MFFRSWFHTGPKDLYKTRVSWITKRRERANEKWKIKGKDGTKFWEVTKKDENPTKDDKSLLGYSKINLPNMPDFNMANPFEKEKKKCILCRMKITPDYKNVRLLSQFVSRFTGMIYGRHITGLCKLKQELVEREIYKALNAGLMPGFFKDPKYVHDPMLFDPENPFRPHRF